VRSVPGYIDAMLEESATAGSKVTSTFESLHRWAGRVSVQCTACTRLDLMGLIAYKSTAHKHQTSTMLEVKPPLFALSSGWWSSDLNTALFDVHFRPMLEGAVGITPPMSAFSALHLSQQATGQKKGRCLNRLLQASLRG
jgi:hypothetical protein